MGHGKSSFVKMLACPEDKPKIKARTDIKSVTSHCSLYRIDPKLNFPKDLFIVDTPGLDSS